MIMCSSSFVALLLLLLLACSIGPSAAAAENDPPDNHESRRGADEQCQDEQDAGGEADGRALPDYIIVGAGGGGIQTALLLQRHGHTYEILEREQIAAPFWTRFPRFDELISINKRARNETQRLRFDWHSFLGTGIGMREISKDYFPTRRDFHKYMTKVVEEEGVAENIRYGVSVERLASDGPCVYVDGGERVCARHRVFVGTGLREKDERYLRAMGGVPYSRLDRDMAEMKRVCILGNGNAGFEAATNTYAVADRVFVFGKQPLRLSAVTKYTGDVRVKFLQTLENFHGKLLDSVYEPNFKLWGGMKRLNSTRQLNQLEAAISAAFTADMHECELLVLATGFESHVPGMDLDGERFPAMTDWYAMRENDSIHFVGWLMHGFDFRRGAGGFLSGYRYLIQNLVHHVMQIDHGVAYPHLVFTSVEQVAEHAASRFQVSDDLVIMQDGVVLRDAVLSVQAKYGTKFCYFEGVTYAFMEEMKGEDDVVYLYLAWGDDRSAGAVFDNAYVYDDTREMRNTKLHPVVEVNGLAREVVEDIHMEFVMEMFVSPVKQIVRDALARDFSKFHERPIHGFQRAKYTRPEGCRTPESDAANAERELPLSKLWEALEDAILADGTEEALRQVRSEAEALLPSVTFMG